MKNGRGFTLIELVISITILGIISIVIVSILTVGVDSYNLFTSHSTMSRETQNLMRIMSDKIPMAIPGTIATATASGFIFNNTNGETIEFEYRSGQADLRYKLNSGSFREILNNITAFVFSYAKSDGTSWVITDPVDEIIRVNVNFNLSMLGEIETYSFNFTIRN